MKKLRDILKEDIESRMKKDPFFQDVKKNRDSAMQPVLKSPPSVTFDKDHSKKLEAGFARVQADLDKLDKKNLPPAAQTKVVTRPELPKVSVKKSNSLPNDDIFAGGNSPFADPGVKSYDRNKMNQLDFKRERSLRQAYQQPPGFKTPSYERARDQIDIDWKSKLPPNPYNDVPAEAVPGSTRPQYTNPMKTSPAVPVPIPKPKAKPAEIDQRVPRPKMRPDKQGPIQRVEIKWPKQIQDRVPQENSGLKGMQADNPDVSGSLLKGFKYEPEKKSKQITDRVPQGETPKLDNTKNAVPIPEPKSVGIDVKPSDKKAAPDQSIRKIQKGDTFWDIAGGNPEEVKRLKKLNPKVNPSKLQIGQEIRLK